MLTARGEEADRAVGLELGADDYVVKPFSGREVVARIRAVLRRAHASAPGDDVAAVTVGPVRLDPASREVTLRGEVLDVSRKEFELLHLLMRNAGTVVTRERLIDEVWDPNWFGSTKTLDVHVSGIRRKLGDDPSRPRYIHTVRGVGFRFSSADGRKGLMSLRLQLLGAFAYVLLLIIVALEVPLALNLARRIDTEVKNEAAAQAFVVAANASGRMSDRAELARLVRSSGETLGARVIVVRANGRLLADSTAAGRPPTFSYASRPEIAAALTGKRAQGERHSRTLGQDLLYTAVPITNNSRVVGVARVTQSLAAVHSRVRRGVLALIAIGAFALVVGLALAWFLASSLSRPLRNLAVTARRLEAGELEARAEVVGPAEQREVATAFNDMADRLGIVLAAQRAFVANASHQLRTPLTGLRLRLESARGKAGGDAARELDAAEREVERLARLLTSLLTLAREGEKPGAARPVSLARAARRAHERWAAAAEQDGRELALVGNGDATIAASDEDLAILLDNLIENALRYSPARVALDWGRDAHDAWLAVLDEGPGLPPARSRACSSASRAGARAAADRVPVSASRSWRRSRAAGAGQRRSPTGSRAGPARKSDSRPRLPCRRNRGSKPRRSRPRPPGSALGSRNGLRRVRRLARLGRGSGDEAAAGAGAEADPATGSHACQAENDFDADHKPDRRAASPGCDDDRRPRRPQPWRLR